MKLRFNGSAVRLANKMAKDADKLDIKVHKLPQSGRVIDCGVNVFGSDLAGKFLAEASLGVAADVYVDFFRPAKPPFWVVRVETEDPLAACIGCQYAGWEIRRDGFFAMGSGPMRAAAGKEELIRQFKLEEKANQVLGVLETSQLPGPEVIADIAKACKVAPEKVTLLCARSGSIPGMIQIVARTIETALHKLHLLGFDLTSIYRAEGIAPLPPHPTDDLTAIGWTNDAIRFGGVVRLCTSAGRDAVEAVGPKVPTSATAAPDVPFLDLLKECGGDFYRLDPMLFGPAVIAFEDYRTFDQQEDEADDETDENGGENKKPLAWGQADLGRVINSWMMHGRTSGGG